MNKTLRQILSGTAVMLFFLYLLLFPEAALHASREGLLLWYHSVLPVLFPFMLLCKILLSFHLLDRFLRLIRRPFHALFGCSEYGAFAILCGFLCGFPMGAKLTSDLYRQEKISRQEAYFLYGFVNNLSPVFLVSYLATEELKLPAWRGLFLFNILGSAALYGILTSVKYRKSQPESLKPAFSAPRKTAEAFSLLDDCIYDAIQNTVRLGAYIMIFSILSEAAALLLPFHGLPALILTAGIEVTNGIHMICASALPLPAKYVFCNVLCAFGGLSALAQSAGIASMDRRLLGHYIKSRVACTLLSLLLTVLPLLLNRLLTLC